MKFIVLTACNTGTQEIQQDQTLRENHAILGLLSSYSLVLQVEAETFAKHPGWSSGTFLQAEYLAFI